MSPEIWISAFGFLGIAVPTAATVYLTKWSKKNIGKSNGHGSLNTAVHRLIVTQTQQDLANEIRFQAVFDHLKLHSPPVPSYELVEQMLTFPHEEDLP